MVTSEEAHSTRGRAHLLFETMRGGLQDAWRSDAVREALDLCLSCRGCKSDCPVNVDVATYKAEFLAHYYQRRLRPRSAYVFGLVYWWARLGSLAPQIANWPMRVPVLSRRLKFVTGIAPAREFPPLAPVTLALSLFLATGVTAAALIAWRKIWPFAEKNWTRLCIRFSR
jgi:Fe-S oxidoreductase